MLDRFLSHIVTTENLNTALNDEEIIPNDYSLVTVKPFKTDGAGFVTDWLVVAERQFKTNADLDAFYDFSDLDKRTGNEQE